ncbi:MAG TPA: alpha/beta hydrolase [Usitatibacter sp.]|nr:alpha/beta hydrolase [Usitatibacter sp.]
MAASSVLFLPGLLEDAEVFAPQIAKLRSRAPCSVADLTGQDCIPAMADEALREAPHGRICLVGHSMGGYVALEILRKAPERVERVAFLNTHARPDTEEATQNRRRLMALAEKDFPSVIDTLMPKLVTEAHQADQALRGTITEMALGVGKEGFMRQQAAIIGRIDSRPHLGRIGCPAMVVAARHDQLMPLPILEELAAGIRGARLEVVDDSGHVSPLEQPEEVAQLLLGWLSA